MEAEAVGRRIKAAMAARGKHVHEVAAYLGVHRATLSNWCRGHYWPHVKHVKAIADHLDVSVAYLLGETDEMARASAHVTA